jgi:hypothetical protein
MLVFKDWAGWNSFAALKVTITFLRVHHDRISHMALVTDSALVDVSPNFASRFFYTVIRHFPYDEEPAARVWLMS